MTFVDATNTLHQIRWLLINDASKHFGVIFELEVDQSIGVISEEYLQRRATQQISTLCHMRIIESPHKMKKLPDEFPE